MKSWEKHQANDPAVADVASQERDRQFVAALARGLEVLRCFTRATPALGTAEIARMTGLPQPTVWRLCHTLLQEGYLVHAGNGDKLRPGIPVLGLGYAAIAGMPIAELARGDMQSIANRHQGAVALGMRDGPYMVYLQRCQGSSIVLSHLDVGSRVPLASSATGWAYMAALREAERESLFEELRVVEEERWPELFPKIKQALSEYAHTGYVVNKGSLQGQINGVAVPLVSDDGAVLMSLSAGGISQVFNDAKLEAVAIELKHLATRLVPAVTALR